MKTVMQNYDLKIRLFKCEKINGLRKFEMLKEVEYISEKFTSKKEKFIKFFNENAKLIDLKINNYEWIKGDTWHDDILYITVEENNSDTYYKVAHFSS